MRIKTFGFRLSLFVAAIVATIPLRAETIEELDVLAEASATEKSGIRLAQEQAGRGEILEAIATLERLLGEIPKSQSARLLHAVYLCRIDDQDGGAVELGKLKRKNFPDALWAEALGACPLAAKD